MITLLAVAGGCGYRFAGQGNPFSSDIQTIAIPIFANQTAEAGLENTIAGQLVLQFSSRKRWKVVNAGGADVVLTGKVLSVDVPDVSFTGSYSGLERRAVVRLSAVLTAQDGRVLWRDDNITREEAFKVDPNPSVTEGNKRDALRKIAADVAEIVYLRIFEDF